VHTAVILFGSRFRGYTRQFEIQTIVEYPPFVCSNSIGTSRDPSTTPPAGASGIGRVRRSINVNVPRTPSCGAVRATGCGGKAGPVIWYYVRGPLPSHTSINYWYCTLIQSSVWIFHDKWKRRKKTQKRRTQVQGRLSIEEGEARQNWAAVSFVWAGVEGGSTRPRSTCGFGKSVIPTVSNVAIFEAGKETAKSKICPGLDLHQWTFSSRLPLLMPLVACKMYYSVLQCITYVRSMCILLTT
jgi:hypothetical protein